MQTAARSPADFGLTGRQLDVLALVMRGQSNKTICRILGLAEPTVKNHVSAILKALNVMSRTEAVVRVGELGWQLPVPTGSEAKPNQSTRGSGPSLPEKPSIAVLPFANLSGDAAQDYFVDGMVEDISMALGRLPWLFVIASTSAFKYKERAVDVREAGADLGVRYLLHGSIRRDGERIRIAVYLADTEHGRQIWNERFEGSVHDIFAMQDRVATQVSAMIAPTLRSREVERMRRKPTDNLSAYDLFLRAIPPHRDDLAQNRESLQLLYRAIELDPSFAGAYGLAAWCHQIQTVFWLAPTTPLITEALRLAQLAVERGDADAEALWMAGRTIAALSGRKDEAIELIEKSIALNPNSARAWWALGIVKAYLGQRELAISHLEKSQRLNPLDMSGHAYWTAVAVAHFFVGSYAEAMDASGTALRFWPRSTQALRLRAATMAIAGKIDEARGCAGHLLELYPAATVASLSAQFALQAENSLHLQSYSRGLLAAGLPEGT
jgi:TolB-like protein/DNA-binding CsgD family transcriptional regulator/tetratricopeptide (TPR) repeat protein